jgi:hypothetical protein
VLGFNLAECGFGVCAVREVRQPESSPLRIRQPVCPDCRLPMRVSTAEPITENALLRQVLFVCDCGRTSDQLITDIPNRG